MIHKVRILNFLLHKKLCKKLYNSRKYLFLKIRKNWVQKFSDRKKLFGRKIFFGLKMFLLNFFLFSRKDIFVRFKSFYSTWFFLAKESWEEALYKSKDFYLHLLVFYPLCWSIYWSMIHETLFFYWKWCDLNVRTGGGGKKLVEGGKKLLVFKVWNLSFNLQKKSEENL